MNESFGSIQDLTAKLASADQQERKYLKEEIRELRAVIACLIKNEDRDVSDGYVSKIFEKDMNYYMMYPPIIETFENKRDRCIDLLLRDEGCEA